MRERILLPFLALLLFPLIANAVVVSRVTDFVPNTKAQADQVDAEFDNIISAINGNLDSENIVDGGIATGDLGTAVVTSGKILDGAVIAGKLGTSAVATANVAAAAVTKEKLSAANIAESASTGTFDFSGNQVAEIATATITTVGRPVLAQFVPVSGASYGYISVTDAELSVDWYINGATASSSIISPGGGGGQGVTVPCSSINNVFQSAAGTYVVRLNFFSFGTSAKVYNCKLVLQEL